MPNEEETIEQGSKKAALAGDEQYYGVGAFIFEIIKIVALAFVIIAIVRVFLFQPFFVQGASMEPNFDDNEYLIINELGYKQNVFSLGDTKIIDIGPFKKFDRESVIVFRYPLDTSKYFIKRVIGLPGEKIEIKSNQVKIYNPENPDGLVLDESAYLSSATRTNGDQTVTLKEDEYFVMGDNRNYSSDSRAWGPVRQKYVMGEVILRAWPLDKITVY